MAWQGHINALRAQVEANDTDITDTVEEMLLDLVQAEGQSVGDALWLIAMIVKAADHKNEGLIRKLAEVGPEHWGAVVHRMEPEPPKVPMYSGVLGIRVDSSRSYDVYRPEGGALQLHANILPYNTAGFCWGAETGTGGPLQLAVALIADALISLRHDRGQAAKWPQLYKAAHAGVFSDSGLVVKHHKAFTHQFIARLHLDAPWEVSRNDVLYMLSALEFPFPGDPGEYHTTLITTFHAPPDRLHTIYKVTSGAHAGTVLWTQTAVRDGKFITDNEK